MTQAVTWSVPVVGPATPNVMAQRIDDSLDALLSGHSGTSRPSYAVAGMVWEDTSVAGVVKYYHYDGSDDILLYTIDTTNDRVVPPPQEFASVASAAMADIGAVTSQNVTVTGTTTITSFGTAPAGTFRRLVFSGALTLTHNATSLILPQGGANIITAAGDSLETISLGSGNWRVTSYQRATPSATQAWVLFTGATGAIVSSSNVTSVTRNGVGDFTINFTAAMQDANYVTFCSVQGALAANVDTINVNNTGGQTTTSVRILAVRSGAGVFDPLRASVMVVR